MGQVDVFGGCYRVDEVPTGFESTEYAWVGSAPQRPVDLRVWLALLGVPRAGRLFERAVTRRFRGAQAAHLAPGFKCLYGNILVGRGVCFNDAFCVDYAPIVCEDDVQMSFDNLLLTSTHDFNDMSRIVARPIVIERNVWITSRCTLLGGVRIGANSVIAAGSVVTRSIPPNVLAGGNPARVIKPIDRCKAAPTST